jgi:glucose/arabinose dehydrogenase
MLVTGKPGLLTVDRGGQRTTALDLRARICADGERGLLGVAVDPAFSSNHFVYLYYTRRVRGSCGVSPFPQSRVGRFVLRNDDTIEPSSEKVILAHLVSPQHNHLAGDLEFGADRLLYVSVGDGVCSLKPPKGCGPLNRNSQDRSVPLGKILRVDRNGRPPATNPYAANPRARRCTPAGRVQGGTGPCKEIFALGLRNPFRIARKHGTSTFYVNDVGLDTWEEVNRLRRGRNYGWNVREGNCRRASTTQCGQVAPYVTPIHAYRHTDCRSVTGGAFVPAGLWPGFDGAYLFADFACGRVFRLDRDQNGKLVRRLFLSGLQGPTHLRFGPSEGTLALYYASFYGNAVRRVALTRTNTAPVASFGYRPEGRVLAFNGGASSDPDLGDAVTRWHWDFGDGVTVESTRPDVTHTYATTGPFQVTLTVTDRAGADSVPVTRTVHSGEHPPLLEITNPAPTTRFSVGQQVNLSAVASDPEDGAIAGSSISWMVRLHHGNHSHPYLGPAAGSSLGTTYPAPENLPAAATSYLVATATVSDSRGISTTVQQRLLPRTVRLRFDSKPRGAGLVVQGTRQKTRFAVVSWAGYRFPVRAPDQRIGASAYTFRRWTDGGGQRRVILTPATTTDYTAVFRRR